MPSEARIRQILAEVLPRHLLSNVGLGVNTAIGRTFYVNSAAGNEADVPDGGSSWLNPLATIDYAIGQCVANRGDVIMVGPGHVETVVAAAGIALDVAGVSIIGVGVGHLRPKINFTTSTNATVVISAANCRVSNIWFNCAIDQQTVLVSITASDCVIDGSEFMIGDGSAVCATGLVGSAASDRIVIDGCKFYSTSSTAITGAISIGAADNSTIKNNEISGYFGADGAIINSAAAVNFNVIGNHIVNRTADGNNKAIVLHASTVGLVASNRMAVIDSTSPAPVTAAAAFVSGNYFTGAVGVTASTLM